MRLHFASNLMPVIMASLPHSGRSLVTALSKSATERMDRKLVAEPNPQEFYFASTTAITKVTKAGTWDPGNIQSSLDQWTFDPDPVGVGNGGSPVLDVGDIDGDGSWDFCVVKHSGAQPSVTYGDGRKELLANAPYGGQKYYNDCVIGDVNGDGQLDVVLAGGHQLPIKICLYNGQGFDACQDLTPGDLYLSYPNSVKLRDIDNDGKLDVVVGYGYASWLGKPDGPWVWMNQGSVGETDMAAAFPESHRVYIPQPTYNNPGTAAVFSVEAADLNNDGYKDIVLTVAMSQELDRKCLVYLSNGEGGGFRDAQKLNHPNIDSVNGQAVADFNGDGRLDIALATGGTRPDIDHNWLLLNQGGDEVWWDIAEGFPGYVNVSPNRKNTGTHDIVAADIDGDGDMDMVWANNDPALYVLINTGSADDEMGNGLFDPNYYTPARAHNKQASLRKAIAVGSTTPGAPTEMPTQAPTAGPLTLDYIDAKANFTSEAPNELEVGYLVGVGHEIKVEVFETCDTNATPVPSGLYNAEEKQDMVSRVPGKTNATHTEIIVGYHFNKTLMTNSTSWDSETDEFTFCQVVSLLIPSLEAAEAYWVILQDRRKIALKFDMESNFVLGVNLDEGKIENTTQTVDFDDDMEAYKCNGGEDDPFGKDPSDLPPNTELAICLKIENESVNIADVTKMTIDQDEETLSVIANSGAVVPQITAKIDVPQEGFIVTTMVPINKFDFEQNKSLNITGVVELELVGSAQDRKLRVLVGEDDAAGEGVDKAGYAVTVNLRSNADGLEPLGSSDGHAIVGNGLAALCFLVVTAVIFVV